MRVLDADAGRAVVGASSPTRTFWWDTVAGTTSRISRHEGYFADIRADRLAVFTANPYDGGCSVVSPLTAPGETLWRSCSKAVLASAPNGKRLLMLDTFSDGPIGRVYVHRDHGRRITSYRSAYSFGRLEWESNRSLLMVAHGARKVALVRCVVDDCERASKRMDSPYN